MRWNKLGLIFAPSGATGWMASHASVPFVGAQTGDLIKVFFSTRNGAQQSAVGYLWFDIKTLQVVFVSDQPVLERGELGCFDDSGVMGSCLVQLGPVQRMYYIGWNTGGTVPFRNSIGVAESYDGGETFNRLYAGPIIDRTKDEPHFTASNCVICDRGIYKTWYLSCTGWFLDGSAKLVHRYHIKYAESRDGIEWDRRGVVAIDYRDEHEYAISVPRVSKDTDGLYKMWFSSRGTPTEDTYRIRYAESEDGISWQRREELVGPEVSETGWDSDMIEYPFVFDHQGKRYMLYNGNGYGETGFGLAVMEHSGGE